VKTLSTTEVPTKRPVTQSGWYETTDGRAAYFCDGCHRDGAIGFRCTETRWGLGAVRDLVDVLL
jgi:hypothetical protein